ncbi:hypothetical protein MKX03_024378, partial [Papaver bracteatum]
MNHEDTEMEFDMTKNIGGDQIEEGSSHPSERVRCSYKDAFLRSSDCWNNRFQNSELEELEEDSENPETMEERVGQEEDPSIPSIEFDAETKKRIIQPWKQCLIGKVVGKTVGYKYISSKTKEMWRLVGKMQILDMGSDYFMFKFEHQDDFKHALLEGPWFINRHNLSLQ